MELGRLERIDLRTAWTHEAHDFTPWLASEANVALLGEAIGVELEVQDQEVNVGPFRADILCRNVADNSLVLIENQLEATDHTHLGQLLTYAAGLDAATLIWIVSRFREEHRAALDWLNRITDDGFHFFGVEIELWRIGNSPPAPRFNLVAKPNDWAKVVKEAAAAQGASTDAARLKLEYWTRFGEFLDASDAPFRAPKPTTDHWVGWGLGRTGAQLCAAINTRDGRVAVWANFGGSHADAYYQGLLADREAIENELGFEREVGWRAGERERKIIVRNHDVTTDPEQWPRLQRWTLDAMLAYWRVVRPRLLQIDTGVG